MRRAAKVDGPMFSTASAAGFVDAWKRSAAMEASADALAWDAATPWRMGMYAKRRGDRLRLTFYSVGRVNPVRLHIPKMCALESA